MLPETKQTLLAAVADDRVLRATKARIDVAASVAEKRIADNWITEKEPDFSTLATKFMSNAKDREKLLRDLKDVSPETSKAVLNSLRREIAQKAMQSESAFGYLTSPANKNALNAAMGNGYQEKLQLIAKMADNLKKTNIDNLNIQLTKQQTDALGSIVQGLDIPFVTSTLRDRIASNTQKVVRLLSRINVSKLQDKTDAQLINVLFDKNGVDKLAKMSADLNFNIRNPLDLKKVKDTFLNNIPANAYIGLQVTDEEE
jgi:DNA-binding NarL/FixJ family response regulator